MVNFLIGGLLRLLTLIERLLRLLTFSYALVDFSIFPSIPKTLLKCTLPFELWYSFASVQHFPFWDFIIGTLLILLSSTIITNCFSSLLLLSLLFRSSTYFSLLLLILFFLSLHIVWYFLLTDILFTSMIISSIVTLIHCNKKSSHQLLTSMTICPTISPFVIEGTPLNSYTKLPLWCCFPLMKFSFY